MKDIYKSNGLNPTTKLHADRLILILSAKN